MGYKLTGHPVTLEVNLRECEVLIKKQNLKGAGGLHQAFLEIDFLVVSDREEYRLLETFYQIKKYCS